MRSIRYKAFTLVEMLVSVSLITILMLAVTQIFGIASRTISGGQAIATGLRDAQAAQSVLSHDLASATTKDSPCLIIRSTRVAAFRNNADYLSAKSPTDPLADTDANGATVNYSPLLYNFRNHRLDYLTFFGRDRFARQTGTNGELVSNTSSSEAAIYMHHLVLPDNSGAFSASTYPGAGNPTINPNNFFASQWQLGRTAILLLDPPVWDNATTYSPAGGETVAYNGSIYVSKAVAGNSNQQPPNASYWSTGTPAMRRIVALPENLSPLSQGSVSATIAGESPNVRALETSRLDLANTSISAFSRILQTGLSATAAPWKSNTLYDVAAMPMPQVIVGGTIYTVAATHTSDATNAPPNTTYWTRSLATSTWYLSLMNDARFRVNPFVVKPITPATASQQVPIFVPACTQFIVEFAGDYLTQDPTTGVETVGSDGEIDKVYNQNPSVAAAARNTGQIRWYGLPRDTSGDGRVIANDGDVVPVCDISRIAMPFEHAWPITGTATPAATANTANKQTPIVSTEFNYYGLTTPPANPEYTCAWGPGDTNRPKLVRITIAIDRPEAAGNLQDGQTFEYVFKVGLN